MKHSHILAEGRKRSENHQIIVQQLWNTVTYTLRTGRGQKTIRSLFRSYETQSHTCWGQEEVRKPSDHCSTTMKHSHIQAEGRKRLENHQITVQQLWNTVTYLLWAGRGQKTIRSLFSSYETQSHTSWWQGEVRKPSDECLAAMEHSYIHTNSARCIQLAWCLYVVCTVTHFLTVFNSCKISSLTFRNHGAQHIPPDANEWSVYEPIFLVYTSYQLRVNLWYDRISERLFSWI